jgi:PAS domain S-box-containing protein
MSKKDKTTEEVIKELQEVRQRIVALEKSEAVLEQEAILNTLVEHVIYEDREMKILWANRAACDSVGLSQEELIGRHCYAIWLKRSDPCPDCPVEKAMETGHLQEVEKMTPDGRVWFIRGYPLRDEKDNIVGGIEFTLEITERRRAEEVLKEREANFRALAENTADGIVVVSRKGNFLYANSKAAAITGYSVEELLQVNMQDCFSTDEYKKVNARFKERIAGATVSSQYRTEIIRKDGTRVPLDTSIALTTWHGELVRIVSLRDITDRKRMDDLVRNQRDLALALNTVRDLDEGLHICLETALSVSGMDCGGIYMVDKASGGLDLIFHKGLSPDFVKDVSHYDADSPNTQLVLAGKPIYTEYLKLKVPLNAVKRREGLRATAVLPMRHKDRVIGYLNLASHTLYEVPHFSRVALEAIAAQIGGSIARLRAEEALRESEERFRRVVETMKVGMGTIDENGVLTYVNEYFCKMLGYSMEEMIGRSTLDFYYDEEGRKAQEKIFANRRAGMQDPAPYEVTWRRKDGQKVYAILSPTPNFDADGRYTGSFAIHIDITERKLAEEALRKSEEKYRLLSENIPVAVYSALPDEHSTNLFLSGQFLDLTGYPMEQFFKNPELWPSIIHPEDRDYVWEKVEEHRRTKGLLEVEYRIITKNNMIKWVRDRARPVLDENGEVIRINGFMEDITERKQAEQALRESEEKYRSLVESSEDSIYLVSNNCNYIFLNDKHCARLGLQNSQVIGRSYGEFHPPEETKDFAQRVNKVLQTGNALSYEYRSQRDNRYFIRTLSPVKSPDGSETTVITVISKDITDLKQAEETLREREAFNFALFQYNPIETIVVDRDGRITRYNMAKKNSGDRLPAIGDLMYKDYAGKHEIDMRTELMKCIRSGKIKAFPERKYGDKYLLITISPFSQGALIISEDITERKSAEDALRESERFSSSLLNDSPHPILVVNPDTSLRYVNPALEKLTGFSAAQLLDRKVPYPWWPKGTLRTTTKDLQEAMRKSHQRIERNFQKKSGERFWIEITSIPAKRDGEVQYLLGNWIDITDRKQAEDLLQRERDTFYSILQKAPYGVMLIDKDGNHPFVNPEFTKITGYTLEDVPTATDWLRQAYPDPQYRNMVSKIWRKDFKQNEADEKFRKKFKKVFARAFNVVCKDGATKEIEFSRGEIGDGGTIAMLADITERKRMHELLETAAAEWRSTFDAIKDPVCLLDQKGKIVRCNNAMLQLTGKPFSEITNHHCWEVIHGVLEAPPVCPFTRVAKTHQRETELFAKNSRWFNVSVDPLLDENGVLVGGVHIMSDISDRKVIEDELQGSREQLRNLTAYLESVREQERTNIAREIHDELAQALTALKMDVSWLDHRLPSDPKSLIEKTQSMNDLIDTTIQTVKRISAELRPGILDDLGLVAAIEWQADEFQNRTGIMCHVTVDPQDITLAQDRSTAIFRIFQETLTNVARHAQASKVAVSLKEKAGRLILRVRDNGRGITEEQISDSRSFGLIGMQERVYPWGGKVSFKGIPGKGTMVVVHVSIGEDKK